MLGIADCGRFELAQCCQSSALRAPLHSQLMLMIWCRQPCVSMLDCADHWLLKAPTTHWTEVSSPIANVEYALPVSCRQQAVHLLQQHFQYLKTQDWVLMR